MSNQLVAVNEIQIMANAVAKSGLFGMKTPEAAMALMLIAQAEGLHPAIAARDYHVINGKPALKADAMLSRFQAAGGKVEWKKYTEEECVGVFSHPQGGSVEVIWTLAMATKAGLTSNPTWKKFSRAMLRARCISEGIRTVYPGVISGFYTPEEVQDFTHEEKDITPQPTPEKKVEKPKAAPKPVIEGEVIKPHARGTISGDASEGDLSMAPMIPKADMDKMLAAFNKIGMDADAVVKFFAKPLSDCNDKDMFRARVFFLLNSFKGIGMDSAAVEQEYNKPIFDWTSEDLAEARDLFKHFKQDWDLKQVELKSTQNNEEVI